MTARTKLADAAAAAGASIAEIPRKDAWRLLQSWREVYCAPIHEATGKWVHKGLGWHTFSYGYFPSIRGRRALDEYHAQNSASLLVLPDNDHEMAIHCTSSSPVDFVGLGDIYIAPLSLEWTMVFTHEDPEYGPYFARAKWRDHDGPDIR